MHGHAYQGCVQKIDKGGQTGSDEMKRGRNPSHICKLKLVILKAGGSGMLPREILCIRASKIASCAF